MNDGKYNLNTFEEEESGFDFKSLIIKLFIHWKWIAISILLCLVCAYFYIRVQTPVYRIQATIMINDEQKGTFQNQMMTLQQDFGIMSTSVGIDNEIEILRSKSIIKQAVIDLKLYTNYSIDGGFASPAQVLYGSYPINVDINREDLDVLTSGIALNITQPNPDTYIVKYQDYDATQDKYIDIKKEIKNLPCTIQTSIGTLTLTKGTSAPLNPDQELTVSIVSPIRMARACLGALSIEPTSKTTAVAYISYLDVNKRRGVDFVNQLVVAYNRENNNDKNQVAIKTEEFIKRRLDIVAAELDGTEEQMAQFKRSSGLTNVTGDAQRILTGSTEYEKQSVEIATQLNLLSYLREYVNNPENELMAIPANVGLSDASLSSGIVKYNEGVIERNRMLRSVNESHPTIIDLTTDLKSMANTIKLSIEAAYDALEIKQKDIERQSVKFTSKLGDAPSQEKVIEGYKRQQEVKSGLYLMLLQKREENSIALAATADNAKLIDAALANDAPVSPRSKMIWLVALAIGVAIPIGLIYLMELLRYKIEGRNDLEKLTKIPILGDVAIAHNLKNGERAIVVKENSNSMMDETFRSIRTNLQFTLDGPDKKVIQFTSSSSGEGKTFVSSNIAMSLALLGKKVILVGLDIRKPRLANIFDLNDQKRGLTTFLSSNPNDKELLFQQIMPSGVNANLDILPAGIVPPNPAELLSRVNLDNAIAFLKEKYDYIILDTAPVGLVSDTLIIARVADATVYICRADYTPKNDLNLLNSLYAESKLKNMSIVLNGVDMTKRKYGYYYGYGNYGRYGRYGYGKYGYGRYGQYGYGRYGQYGYGNEKK
ncbi:MAG: polysaccharide biosynthesis tyrosine autokinase [Bacteroidales bacterium]|nr:polysaccharide biosynthesis tyrosine autokinase [Bacteroidales bacterium]